LLDSRDAEVASLAPGRLVTGAINLDWALSGGIPSGRTTEIYSKNESEGKTSILMSVIAATQRAGGRCLFIDAEEAMDKERLVTLGVDIKSLYYCQPKDMEEAFAIIQGFILKTRAEGHKGEILVVWDTLAATPTRAQNAAEYVKSEYAPQATLMSYGMRKLNKVLADNMVTLIIANQAREKVGVVYGRKFDTPGGKALKFFSSLRLECRRTETIKGTNKSQLGITVRVWVAKSKVGTPFRTADVDILFASGIDPTSAAFRFARQQGIIVREGSFFKIVGQTWKPFRESRFGEFLGEHPEMESLIEGAFEQSMLVTTVGERVDSAV
jgi:recombination protein RecA